MSIYQRTAFAARTRLASIPQVHQSTKGIFTTKAATTRSASSTPVSGTVVDQTKTGNDPDQGKKDEHVKAGQSAGSAPRDDHPAKQADPQKAPERSTGIQSEGPNGNAGEGKVEDVHKQEKPPLTK